MDPITKNYPWYTPYQFAGNTPIEAINMDGLEPVKGDLNYGKNLIFGNLEAYQSLNPSKRDLKNENWLGYKASTLSDIKIQISNLKSTGVKIQNVYIQVHGSVGILSIVDKKEGVTDINCTDAGCSDKSYALSTAEISSYLEIKGRMQSEDLAVSNAAKEELSYWGKSTVRAINNLIEISSQIEDGGTLIIAGCHSGYGEGGDELLKGLNKLLGNRLKIYLCQDFVIGTENSTVTVTNGKEKIVTPVHQFLDVDRSGKMWLDLGWKYITPKADEPTETKKDLKLNSTGEPVTDHTPARAQHDIKEN